MGFSRHQHFGYSMLLMLCTGVTTQHSRPYSAHVGFELLALLDDVATAGHAAAGEQHFEQSVACVP